MADTPAQVALDERALLAAFRANHHADAEPSSVELERARIEARELAERAGIDMLDDHDQFIDDLTETLVRFARHRKQGGE